MRSLPLLLSALLTLLAVPFAISAQTPPEKTTEAVIFDDDRYDVVGWAGEPKGTLDFFERRGFKGLKAEDLAAWMAEKAKQGAYGTVALLPTGIVPGSILEPGGWQAVEQQWLDKQHFASSVARKYMEAGGRLVWMGDVTFYYLQGPSGPIRCAGGLMPQLVDVSTDQRIFYGPPNHEQALTEAGKRWGLTQPWYGMPANTGDVTETLVAAPKDKASLIFLKTLNSDCPLSGLLSFPIKLRGDELNLPLLADIYKAANFWGKPVTVPVVTALAAAQPDLELTVRLGDAEPRSVFLSGEEIKGLITAVNRKAALAGKLTVTFADDTGTYFSQEKQLGIATGEVPLLTLAIPTKTLRCGSYRLEVSLAPESGKKVTQALEITLIRKSENPFFIGIWGQLPGNPFRRAQYLDDLKAHHLNAVCGPGFDDDLLRRGMTFIQRIEAYEGFPNGVDPAQDPDLVQLDQDRKPVANPWVPARSKVSIAHPQVITAWSEGQSEQIAALVGCPAWFPTILSCDDFSAFYGEDFGPYSSRLFQERTGKTPPQVNPATKALPVPAKGIVPDDDLRLLWREHTVRDLGGFINRAFTEAKQRVAPGVPFGPVPGGMMVPLWTESQYPPASFGTGGFDLLSYYYYNTYWQPEIGNLYFDEIARLGNRNLPLWTTPDVYTSGNEPSYYRNAFFMHMAGGVSGLNYYAYSEHKQAAYDEVGRLAGMFRDLGPLQAALKPARKRLGLYMPLACNAVDWSYPISALYAFSNLLAAHVDAEPTCREELLDGRAFQYDALVTWNADWISRSEADALARYIQRGGKLLLDASSEFTIPGAIKLPVDLAMGKRPSTMNNDDPRFASPGQQDYNWPERVAAVREALRDYVVSDPGDPTVVTRAFDGQGASFLWCANIHTNEEYKYLVERMPGYKRTADRPVAEEEGRKFLAARGVYDKQVETPLTLPPGAAEPAVFDLWARKRLAVTKLPDGHLQVPLSMERLGGTLLAMYSSAPVRVSVEAFPAKTTRGKRIACEARVYGENGLLMRGLLPCRLRFLDPKGQETFSQAIVLRDGRDVFSFTPAKNDSAGSWTIELTELAGGTTGRTAVAVQ